MFIGVSEYAASLGVTSGRVIQLIRDGRLQARRTGGIWLIDSDSGHPVIHAGRPLSPRMTAALLLLLSGEPSHPKLTSTDSTRLRAYARRLREAPEPAALINSWLRTRAEHTSYRVSRTGMSSLVTDPRITKSGVSDPRTKLGVPAFEGYLPRRSLRTIVRDYSLELSSTPNVFLHTTKVAVPKPVLLGITIADLAMHPEYKSTFLRMLEQAIVQQDPLSIPKVG
jgi:hypothetical protein